MLRRCGKKGALLQCWYVCAQSLPSCPTLCDPMNRSLLASSVHGILQVRILEWIAISFSRESFRPRDWTYISSVGRWILYHWVTWKAQEILVSTSTGEKVEAQWRYFSKDIQREMVEMTWLEIVCTYCAHCITVICKETMTATFARIISWCLMLRLWIF